MRTTPWRIVLEGNDVLLGERLDRWDPGMDLSLLRTVEVDVDSLRREVGVPASAPLAIATSWHATGTTLRSQGDRRVLPETGCVTYELNLRARGHLLAGGLRLRTTIAPTRPLAKAPLRATRPGAILWEDEVKLALEGGASRFPMEVLSFTTAGWHLPNQAAWALEWDPLDLEIPVLGGLRLYLNLDHSAVARAVATSSEPTSKVLLAAMQMDVGRQLLMGALASDEFVDRVDKYPKGSVGDVIRRLIRSRFKGESPRALRDKWRQDPERFEALIQAALRAFGDL